MLQEDGEVSLVTGVRKALHSPSEQVMLEANIRAAEDDVQHSPVLSVAPENTDFVRQAPQLGADALQQDFTSNRGAHMHHTAH